MWKKECYRGIGNSATDMRTEFGKREWGWGTKGWGDMSFFAKNYGRDKQQQRRRGIKTDISANLPAIKKR